MYQHTSKTKVELYLKMPRKTSKAVPEGNDPVPQYTSGLLGGIKLEEIRRMLYEALGKSFDNLYGLKYETSKEIGAKNQRLAGLEHDAW